MPRLLRRETTGFPSVMATGVLSLAAGRASADGLSRALAVVAAALFLVAVIDSVARPRWPTADSFAAVAATCVLGARLATAGHGHAALACLAAAFVLWLAVWLALRGLAHARGTRLLAVVATQALAVLACEANASLASVALAGLALGLVLYARVIVAFRARELREGPGDHWIAMGALAISSLAAGEAHARLGGGTLAAVSLALWAAASAWILPLAVAELRRPRLRFHPKRWSTVFPLGMYALASATTGDATGLALGDVTRAFFWLGLTVWVVTLAGAIRAGSRSAPTAESYELSACVRAASSPRQRARLRRGCRVRG
jgi:hypothetical protein